jgi:hypothetical protein
VLSVATAGIARGVQRAAVSNDDDSAVAHTTVERERIYWWWSWSYENTQLMGVWYIGSFEFWKPFVRGEAAPVQLNWAPQQCVSHAENEISVTCHFPRVILPVWASVFITRVMKSVSIPLKWTAGFRSEKKKIQGVELSEASQCVIR